MIKLKSTGEVIKASDITLDGGLLVYRDEDTTLMILDEIQAEEVIEAACTLVDATIESATEDADVFNEDTIREVVGILTTLVGAVVRQSDYIPDEHRRGVMSRVSFSLAGLVGEMDD